MIFNKEFNDNYGFNRFYELEEEEFYFQVPKKKYKGPFVAS